MNALNQMLFQWYIKAAFIVWDLILKVSFM